MGGRRILSAVMLNSESGILILGASSSLARIPSDLHFKARHPRQQKKVYIRFRRVPTMETLLCALFTRVINHCWKRLLFWKFFFHLPYIIVTGALPNRCLKDTWLTANVLNIIERPKYVKRKKIFNLIWNDYVLVLTPICKNNFN